MVGGSGTAGIGVESEERVGGTDMTGSGWGRNRRDRQEGVRLLRQGLYLREEVGGSDRT